VKRLAGVTLVIALLTACSAPAPDRSAPQGSASSSATAAQTAAPSASPAVPWVQLTSGIDPNLVGEAGTPAAWWSPDSQWLLVASGVTNGPPDQQVLTLRDRTGRILRTMQGTAALWVDARTFIDFTGTESLLGSVDSPTLTSTGPPAFVSGPYLSLAGVSNGHGAVAYPLSGSLGSTSTFAVWTASGTSAPVPGYPEAWSADGRHLAVWRPTEGRAPMANGWVEVLSWPGLHSELQLKEEVTSASAPGVQLFDPAGTHLSVGGVIADLTTGSVVHLAIGFQAGDPAWNGADELVVPSLEGGPAAVFDVGGHQIGSIEGTGDSMSASADGSLVVSWNGYDDSGPITVIRGTTVEERITVPGPLHGRSVALAPDGSALAAWWTINKLGEGAFLLHL
jgi:hypothetical protein